MKKADFSRLETLEALIAEKRKQETFLAKLEERRAGTPEHVFNRLRDEYLTKQMDAQVRAATEAETLLEGLEEDDAAVAEVEAKLAVLIEERVEMQLRADVEDWEPKEAQKKLTAMTAAISMAEKERDARKSVAERTRALLTEARGGAQAAGQPLSAGGSAEKPPMRPTTAAMAGGPNFDELAFLNSVVGRASTPATAIPRETKADVPATEIKESPSAPKPVPEAPRIKTPSAPAAAVSESVAGAVPASPAPAPAPRVSNTPAVPAAPVPPAQPSLELESPKAMPAVSSAPADSPAAAPAAAASQTAAQPAPSVEPVVEKSPETAAAKSSTKVPEAPSAKPAAPSDDADEESDEPPSILGRPTPRTSQAIKTLKCAECGSMNYPTEWYCERCGGELAAL